MRSLFGGRKKAAAGDAADAAGNEGAAADEGSSDNNQANGGMNHDEGQMAGGADAPAETSVTVVATGGDPSGAVSGDIKPVPHLQARNQQKDDDKKPLWLKAWTDPLAGVNALSECTNISDLIGDGEGMLAVANKNKKLLIFKGTNLHSEHKLLATPSCISHFYVQAGKAPALAIAAGGHVFIYRNLRPYYRFNIPTQPLDGVEVDAWSEYASRRADAGTTAALLSQARDNGANLSAQSMDFLSFEDDASRDQYGQRHAGDRLEPTATVTCMSSLRTAMDEPDAASCLVLACEDGRIMLLNTAGTKMDHCIQLPAPACKMVATGLRDIEYRIIIACRNGKIYSIKNGEMTSTVIELESMAVALLRPMKTILVVCMNNSVCSYHLKGKKTYSLYMPAPIVDMEYLSVATNNTSRGAIVALRTGEIRLYNDKHLVGKIDIGEVPKSLTFGRYGREDATLAITGNSGTLHIYILARLAKLHMQAEGAGPPPEQDIPLPVPKKTKLYVEQTQREREQCIDMHRVFQRDLCKLRLSTARAYAKVLSDGQGPVSTTASASVRVQCNVMGLGPMFKVKLTVQNTGSSALTQVPILANADPKLYEVTPVQMTVPTLVPLLSYVFEVSVRAVNPAAAPGMVTIYVMGKESALPLLCVQVQMPASDISDLLA